jgi:predicted phosphodiesterase
MIERKYTDFFVSDVHSYYHPLKEALDAAGFDLSNPLHRLIICGDIFDRGPDTVAVYQFVNSIPKDRRILIRGNHDLLYYELLKKSFPHTYDFSNGTVDTFCQIAGVDPCELSLQYYKKQYYRQQRTPDTAYIQFKLKDTWDKVVAAVWKSEITAWLFSDEWVTYYESDDIIAVHSFIPLEMDWRNASAEAWERAMWGCPWKQFKAGFFKEEAARGKTLIVGHWHAEEFHVVFEQKHGDYELYFGPNLVALDGMTALTYKVPVLKISPDGCFDKYSNRLGDVLR